MPKIRTETEKTTHQARRLANPEAKSKSKRMATAAIAADRRAVLHRRRGLGHQVASDLGAGADHHVPVEDDHVLLDRPDDLRVTVQDHEGPANRSVDLCRTIEDDGGIDGLTGCDDELAGEHDLVCGWHPVLLGERRSGCEPGHGEGSDHHGNRASGVLLHPEVLTGGTLARVPPRGCLADRPGRPRYGGPMETWEAIRTRRNVRRFEDRQIPAEHLDRIVAAAALAPSSMNEQRWAFVVCVDRDRLEALAGVGDYAGHVAGAAAAVAFVSPRADDGSERESIAFDLGQAVENAMLVAWELGIGSCHASVYDEPRIRTLLEYPPDHDLRPRGVLRLPRGPGGPRAARFPRWSEGSRRSPSRRTLRRLTGNRTSGSTTYVLVNDEEDPLTKRPAEARRARGSPLWAKAPLALVRYPGLLAAVVVGALLLSLVAAAFPLFLSRSEGELLRAEIADPTVERFGAGLFYSVTNVRFRERLREGRPELLADRLDEEFRRIAAAGPHLASPVRFVQGASALVTLPGGCGAGVRPGRGIDLRRNRRRRERRRGRGGRGERGDGPGPDRGRGRGRAG